MGTFKENPSKHALYMREWVKRHPEYKERSKLYSKERLSDPVNAQKNRDRMKKWREDNWDRAMAAQAEHTRRRRAKIKGATIGKIDFDAINERCAGLCGICGGPLGDKIDYDHIVPVSKGGSHTTENLQTAHPRCNKLKSDRLDFSLKDEVA